MILVITSEIYANDHFINLFIISRNIYFISTIFKYCIQTISLVEVTVVKSKEKSFPLGCYSLFNEGLIREILKNASEFKTTGNIYSYTIR